MREITGEYGGLFGAFVNGLKDLRMVSKRRISEDAVEGADIGNGRAS